jgi:hypothetical protein
MSKKIYDYYPNKVMKISIFKDNNYNQIEILSKTIIKRLKNTRDNKDDDIIRLQQEINKLIEQSLDVQSLI